ncbi:hypothetical protein ACNKHU_00370 [Shigella flexneri]
MQIFKGGGERVELTLSLNASSPRSALLPTRSVVFRRGFVLAGVMV